MEPSIFSPKQIDYLAEMMEVGGGNAVTALEQILQARFEMRLPAIHVVQPHKALSVIGDPEKPVTCIKMNMVGDVKGEMFFIVPQEMETHIINLAETSAGAAKMESEALDTSTITEIGNILAGVYLRAIHDFSNLNIYHTIPVLAMDMAQALLDETIALISDKSELLIIVVNSFVAAQGDALNTYLIVVPELDSLKILLDSIQESKRLTRG